MNSSRLWDNRQVDLYRTPVFIVPKMVLYALIAAAIPLTIHPHLNLNRSVPDSKVTSQSAQVAIAQTSAVKADSTDENLSPSNSPQTDPLAAYVLQQLDKPAPPVNPPATDCVAESCLALTFDDGPNTSSTANILTSLEQAHAPATFFLIGAHVVGNVPLVQRMNNDGDAVGNHSWTHPDFTKIPPAQIQQQIMLTQTAITATGAPTPLMFRPPYGSINTSVEGQIPMAIVTWNVDPRDWAQTDPGKIVQLVESQAKPGAIILLHDKVLTAQALPKILADLAPKYHLVTVPDLLNLTPDSRGVFRGR